MWPTCGVCMFNIEYTYSLCSMHVTAVSACGVCAYVQVVVPQGVLVRASAELTVTQALEIADMTLETSCRAIQWAINVPEVLLASAGEGPDRAAVCPDT